MNCQRCHKPSPPDALYCPYCGRNLSPSTKKGRNKSRGNGTGTAFKRGSTWTAQVVLKYEDLPPFDPANPVNQLPRKKITRSKGGFKTRDEALRYCPILKNGPEKPKEAPTLLHYWEVYKETGYKDIGKSKQQAYRTAWKKLEKLGPTRIDQLTITDLQGAVDARCTTYYPAKDCRTLLTHLFEMAAAEGYVRPDLPSYISIPTLEESEQIPFSETEQAALWRQYESGDIRAARHLLMIYTGMMPGEAMKLRVDQIDLDKRIITGAGIKTKVRRKNSIVLAENIIPLVQDLIDHAQPSGYIWKRNEKRWYDEYHAVLEEAGCRDLDPYSCRHTTATALAIDKRVAPQTVQKVMRWSSTKLLDRYAHPDQADAMKAVNRIKKKKKTAG